MQSGIPLIRAQIEARLRALDEERAALKSALTALSDIPAAIPAAASVPARTPRTRARRGENLAKILPVIAASPGLAPREIAEITGIDPRVVSATLSKLRRDGRIANTSD